MSAVTPVADHRSPIVPEALVAAAGRAMDAYDRAGDRAFPGAAWALLAAAGVPGATATGDVPVAEELTAVRAISRADVSLGRLLDGHYNGVQRLALQVDDDVAREDLAAVAAGELRLGVWGADPAPGEGVPARLRQATGGWVLDGDKTFCSGAGGLHRAFVLARGPHDDAPLRLAYVDLGAGVTVDEGWFAGAGMRASVSHRVSFRGATVLWVADEPRALLAQPWFAQDGLRTAAGWAGGADAIAEETLATLRAKGNAGDVEALAVARIAGARRAMDLWLGAGAEAVAADAPDVADQTLLARVAIAAAVQTIIDEAAHVVGARPFATGGRLERACRDLRTYLLQHRLEPPLVAFGHRALEAGGP